MRLQAKGEAQERILAYLEENASDALKEKIEKGSTTLDECFKYITSEAKKKAVSGVAMIEDKEVFGWAVHYFEEDGKVKIDKHVAMSPVKAVDVKELKQQYDKEAEKEKKAKKEKKDEISGQMSLFDML